MGSPDAPGAEPETCLSLALGEPEAAAGAALARRQLEATGCEKRKGTLATSLGKAWGCEMTLDDFRSS